MGLNVRNFLIVLLITILIVSCKEKDTSFKAKIFRDEIGNEIHLNSKPLRIISAAPNITEIIFAIDAQNMLVGRTAFCNYPESVKNIPVIGDMLNLNFEKIVELKPDLIFMTVEGNTKETFDKLKTLGVEVYVVNPRDINGILNSIKNIAEVLDKKDTARTLIRLLQQRIDKIHKHNLSFETAMFVISFVPLMIAGKNTFINDILKHANLKNISPSTISSYPIISREEVLKKNPDWIFIPSSYSMEEILEYYPEWKNLSAIQKEKIVFVDPDLFFRPGPRFIEALEFLVEKIKFKHFKD
ncbi:MAG: ABC transporter substrate-binding protein [Ignavibacteria bacterium]